MLFLSDDINLLSNNDIKELVKYFNISENIGAVGAKLMNIVDNTSEIISDGVWIDSSGKCFDIDSVDIDYNLSIPRNVSALVSQCLLTNRIAFNFAGGFDERFSTSFYNIDYCLSLRNLGYRVMQASDVEFLHLNTKEQSAVFSNNNFDSLSNEEAVLITQKWKKFFRESFVSKRDIYLSGTRILNF
jgi:GT2 family glycosyltransferase